MLLNRSSIPLIVAVTLAAVACPGPDTVDEPVDAVMATTLECVNRTQGYSITYPAEWHTNTGDILEPCSLFDPDPIEVPRDSEIPIDIAILMGVERAAFGMLTGDVLGRRVQAREPTTVGGREAMRIDGETTGEGLYDAGIGSYEYFVDLGDRTLVAATYGVGALAYERKRKILDAMMASIEFGSRR